MDLNGLMNADLTGIEIELSEELETQIREYMAFTANLMAHAAVYLYGPSYTVEDLENASHVVMLYMAKLKDKLIAGETLES